MRHFARFSKGLLGAGLIAGALLSMSGCGDYALYKVDIISTDSSNRGDIAQCRITITADDSAKPVLDHYSLNGCPPGQTKSVIGTFSYSSSRSSGNLKFTVEAYDANGYDPTNRSNNLLQSGEVDNVPVKVYPPEIPVSIAIKKP